MGASGFRRGDPGVGTGRHGRDRSEDCRRGRELQGTLGALRGGRRRGSGPTLEDTAPGGAALRSAYARPPGPAPTHLRALNRRNHRKCRRPAPLRRPHYFRDALGSPEDSRLGVSAGNLRGTGAERGDPRVGVDGLRRGAALLLVRL